jgi:hypothetical protein
MLINSPLAAHELLHKVGAINSITSTKQETNIYGLLDERIDIFQTRA